MKTVPFSPCARARSLAILASLLAVTLGLFPTHQAQAYPHNPLPSQPGFGKGIVLPGAGVEYGSPVVADLDKDGKKEIVVGGADGKVYAVRSDGSLMWVFDVTAAINARAPRPGKAHIDSVPAVADLDNDGWPEVVVSAGSPTSVVGYNGGMVVLSHDGKLRPGWPQVGVDQIGPGEGPADGWLEGFYSSPALADLDGDGDREIVVGGWDMRFYAWHHDGRLVAGWPRFASDTVWSSPAIADLDGDGRPEVIIGRDAAVGGFLEVLRGDGSAQPGFPKQIDQTIFSSPAIADLNGDGRLDIVVGAGNYFAGRGMAVYAWDASGNPLPGWPAPTGGYTLSAPSVGDLDGDGAPEVVIGANDGKAYAFHGNGQPVAGWPVLVQDNFGNQAALNFSAPVLANFDQDPLPEVFINSFCDTVVIDGNGALLTHVENSGAPGRPSMYIFDAWCLGTTPAVADLEGDGKLEVVRAAATLNAAKNGGANGLLAVWELGSGSTFAPWPMFRRDPEHSGRSAPRALVISPGEVRVLTTPNRPQVVRLAVGTSDQANVSWRAQSSAGWAKVQTSTGQTPGTLAVSIQPAGMGPGSYSATIEVADPNGVYPKTTVTVRLDLVSKLVKTMVPLMKR